MADSENPEGEKTGEQKKGASGEEPKKVDRYRQGLAGRRDYRAGKNARHRRREAELDYNDQNDPGNPRGRGRE